MKVASVATAFPSGQSPLDVKLADVRRAVELGADEIDMVIDRGAMLSGDYAKVFDEIAATKEACGPAHLKVITLETGELRVVRRGPQGERDRHRGGRRLHQDLDWQGNAGRDAAGDPRDARGHPRPLHCATGRRIPG